MKSHHSNILRSNCLFGAFQHSNTAEEEKASLLKENGSFPNA